MNLYINSPAYYTQKHGIVDEIHQMCSLISRNIDITLYTEELDTIGITPIIAPTKEFNSEKWREVKIINLSLRMANISLISDYDAFLDGDVLKKRKIILENIFQSLKVIKKKMKNKFNYEKIVRDIMALIDSCLTVDGQFH